MDDRERNLKNDGNVCKLRERQLIADASLLLLFLLRKFQSDPSALHPFPLMRLFDPSSTLVWLDWSNNHFPGGNTYREIFDLNSGSWLPGEMVSEELAEIEGQISDIFRALSWVVSLFHFWLSICMTNCRYVFWHLYFCGFICMLLAKTEILKRVFFAMDDFVAPLSIRVLIIVDCIIKGMDSKNWRKLRTPAGRAGSWRSSPKRCAIVRGILFAPWLLLFCLLECTSEISELALGRNVLC